MLSQNPEPKLKYSKIRILMTSHFSTHQFFYYLSMVAHSAKLVYKGTLLVCMCNACAHRLAEMQSDRITDAIS